MKRLTNQDWSLIARYLREEATAEDMDQLNTLLESHPNLEAELSLLNKDLKKPVTPDEFDADAAFQKLHQRFKNDKLI